MYLLAVRVLAHPAVTLLATTGGGASVSINGGLIASVIQFGFLGAVFIDVVGTHKFLVPAWTLSKIEDGHDKELALKDALIDSLKSDMAELKVANGALQTLAQEKTIPALVQATEVARAYVTELARRTDRGDRGDRGMRDGT